jgi:hypothetical protein
MASVAFPDRILAVTACGSTLLPIYDSAARPQVHRRDAGFRQSLNVEAVLTRRKGVGKHRNDAGSSAEQGKEFYVLLLVLTQVNRPDVFHERLFICEMTTKKTMKMSDGRRDLV